MCNSNKTEGYLIGSMGWIFSLQNGFIGHSRQSFLDEHWVRIWLSVGTSRKCVLAPRGTSPKHQIVTLAYITADDEVFDSMIIFQGKRLHCDLLFLYEIIFLSHFTKKKTQRSRILLADGYSTRFRILEWLLWWWITLR